MKTSLSFAVKTTQAPGFPDLLQYHLSNGSAEVVILNYGGTIVSVKVPDREGEIKNIAAGFSNPVQYFEDHPYLGSIVGRYANRIAYGKFNLAGREYSLPVNNDNNHLHGGVVGFHRKFWQTKQVINDKDKVGVTLCYSSPHGEEGYPGNLEANVTYILTTDNQLIIRYSATSDQPTIINLTNHSYFNLTGFENPHIYDHQLRVNSTSYTEKNENNTPTGNFLRVHNTPFDFRDFRSIGNNIHLLKKDKGYDHNFVLHNQTKEVSLAAELYEPLTGILLKVFTDKPGIQVYTANWWDGTLTGEQGKKYEQHGAVALETQSFPDSPNHPNFPSTVLIPGEVYESETRLQFLTINS